MDKKAKIATYEFDQKSLNKEKTRSFKFDEISKEIKENEKKYQKDDFLDMNIEKNMDLLELIQQERSWNRNNTNYSNKENTKRVEFNSNDENSENIEDKKKQNEELEKLMKINYNYISCIDSKRKPDIYIGGKINLPAKNYRFSDITKKEANLKNQEDTKIVKNEIDELNKNKTIIDQLSKQATDSIKTSKIYLNEENEQSNKIIDITKLEELKDKENVEDDIEELKKKRKSYDSDADIDDDLEKFDSEENADDNAEKEKQPKKYENRYFSQQNITMKCYNCGEIGHYARNCPNDLVIHCTKCNGEGHEESMCPNIKCFKCNRIGHKSYECKATKEIEKCSRCKNIGHLDEDCLINPYEIPNRVFERSCCPICDRKGVLVCKGRRDYTLIDDYNSEEVNLSDSVDEGFDLNVGFYDILQGKIGTSFKTEKKTVIKPGSVLHFEHKETKRKTKKSVIENLDNNKIKDTIFCPKCAERHQMKDCKVKLKDNEFDRMRQRYSQNMFRNNREDYRRNSNNNYSNRYNGSDKKKNQYRKIYDDDNSSNESINDIINSNIRKRKFSAASFNDFNDEDQGKNLSLDESSSERDYRRKNDISYKKHDNRRSDKKDNYNYSNKNDRNNNQYYNTSYKMTTNTNNSNYKNNSSYKSNSYQYKSEQYTLNNSQDNNFSNNLQSSNTKFFASNNSDNKILPENSNLTHFQIPNNLNFPNYQNNNFTPNLKSLLFYNNLSKNLNSGNLNSLNVQNVLNGNANLLQNLTHYFNLKNQLNNQIDLNQNKIYINQNNPNLIYYNQGLSNNLIQNHNCVNSVLNTNQNFINGLNFNQNISNNILSQNNNIYLNEANFNSAYKIEKKSKEDIQFNNLLNEGSRKVIIMSENLERNKDNKNNSNFNNEFLNKKRSVELAEEEYHSSKRSNNFYNNRLNNNSNNRNNSYNKGNNRNNKKY